MRILATKARRQRIELGLRCASLSLQHAAALDLLGPTLHENNPQHACSTKEAVQLLSKAASKTGNWH